MLTLLAAVIIIPLMQVVTISVSPASEATKYGLHLIPKQISWEGYKKVFNYSLIWTSYFNTIVRVAVGTSLNIFMVIIGAYPLSKKYLPNLKFWTILIIITMYFSGGLVPNYILITKYLGLRDSFWALILPTATSAYNLMIVRNFFSSLPESLEESARLDGAGDFRVLFQIVVPLSKPVIATVSLWCIVAHWNAWFDCLLYINSQSKYVLQLVLRQLLLEGQTITNDVSTSAEYVNNETMKMATIVVSTLPVLCIYPFLQKYFVQGIMLGAVKG
jgi:putative aldouronate transport system permease protein